jgi:cyanophycinase-like exopeptidase
MMGRLIIMGSGEMAPGLVATHRAGIEAAGADGVVILDTPFGFQENVEQLTDRLVAFFDTSLNLPSAVASLRGRNADDLERQRFLAAIRSARYVFAGPGSPSYALDVWSDTGVEHALRSVIARGGTVTFASAASLALGRTTIPVYEIYKVGAEPTWLDGLDLMTELGLPCSVVPHWNNAEGGNHDTSRCYIGERRLKMLEQHLEVGILGVDEHTAAIIDLDGGVLTVAGRGSVTLRGEEETILESGTSIGLDKAAAILGAGSDTHRAVPPSPSAASSFAEAVADRDADALLGALLEAVDRARNDDEEQSELRAMMVEVVRLAEGGLRDPREVIGGLVEVLLEVRLQARRGGDYESADRIRTSLLDQGIEVRDTAGGTEWVLLS